MSCPNCNSILIPCNCGGTVSCCGNLPPACNCPPSPTPPWARESMSPLTQVLFDSAVPLTLDPQTTILNQTQSDPINNLMVLPNGAFTKQSKSIYVLASILSTTATWTFSGIFAGGYTKLVFNNLGYNALLFWDGTAWQLTGGNAILTP